MRYGMAIDTKLCFGCTACAVACKSNNNLPNGVWWNQVHTDGGAYADTAAGTYPNLTMAHYPVGCQHCANPACVDVCPTGASYQREDGIVLVNADECIGCESCIQACPYGVRTLNESEPAFAVDFALGDFDAPEHRGNTVEKCTFCFNRLDRGEMPACMEFCPGRARFWGDLDDPESDVSKAIAGRETIRLKEEAGTEPSVYYLI